VNTNREDDMKQDRRTFLKTTAVRSLTKPFPLDDLRRVVQA